ncbi:serine/threonine protein kinase PrkC, regulator of stationary phase [Lachnospiraceae bacterium KM106-2]|nr:serine/threonine protein kinase PrkC, regulator of stationary phase [Lachnospiraceae bacterium KM106-2]
MIKPGMFISDRYEMIEKVGSGGMADVYKARDHRLNRFVAIKVLKPEYSDDKSFVQKFRAEAQSAAGLSHPNIVNVYDVGDDQGLYYIVMELVEGITLKSFIERKNKLEVREGVGIAIQIAQGMEAAHANHIIHRDIKPQNIIISREGKVKVTDFGIAKAASSNTITSNAMGSVHYISPEQARGGYSDERSDIYSLGITLYEMLSGMVPFAGENTVSVALLHIQGEAMPLREIDPSIPVSLEKIVAKCMEKKPERRYQSASELIADLKRSLRDPSGDFVKIMPTMVDSSPTINLSQEDLDSIKSQSANKADPKPQKPVEEKEEEPIIEDVDDEDDDDDDSEVDPKFEKIIMGIGIGLCVIFVIALLAFVAKALGFGSSANGDVPSGEATASSSPTPGASDSEEATEEPSASPEVSGKVPSVVGKTLTEATEELEAAGYVVRTTEKNSDTYEKDSIISQDPKEGEEAEEGSTVNLVVSLGAKQQIKVPYLSGKTVTYADSALSELGLNYKHQSEYSDSVEKDHVIKTTPGSGSTVYKGDSVTIIVSKGPEAKMTKVPKLLGMNEEQARTALEAAGLTMSTSVLKDYSNTYGEGTVMRQSLGSGKSVKEGTVVTITISLGAKATPTPAASYVGTVTLSRGYLPEGFESGTITLKLVQNGSSKVILSQQMSADQIPYTTNVKGFAAGQAEVEVIVDGENTGSIPVTFTQQ